ncbi:MAG: 16S rRNA (adenine(1518)-N(6)/adenine(1519)-N(6))-dimethyltransferase RsmA [Alistipes sp.]|jgi:16S rRNA (adenine1518-N6/adenine1519-N6)-dimethyltransferase|nr:16S rRNA (adenine(1518)-N(6)/adenine(1519)-N(6))-dimethyltransferase RsmA [Alistipes sp.]
MGYAKNNTDAVRAKKSLGQHFLTDLNIARRIAEAVGQGSGRNADSDIEYPDRSVGRCNVLEIGGGMGVLTRFLLERTDITLWGIEIDRESIAYMREHFPDFATGGPDGTGRLIEGDFLKFDLHDFCQKCTDARLATEPDEEHTGSYVTNRATSVTQQAGVFHGNPHGVRIVGNFPYNISSQIFFKVLENRDLVPEVVGMIQREVAQRIAEPPGSRTYGILSVLLQAWYDIEYLFTVSEGVFSPPPKVKSAVVRLTRNSTRELGCDEVLFVKVVKAAFGQRRKMIRNSLRSVFGDFGGAEHPFFTTRAEQLSVAQFVELTNWVSAHTR